MKTAFIVLSLSAAALVGYYFGLHRKGVSPRSGSEVPGSAIVRESARVDAHLAATPAASTTDAAQYDPVSVVAIELDAMRRGDVPAVARCIVLTPEAKAVIESALPLAPSDVAQEYPTPELIAAFVFCGAQRIQGFRIESTIYDQPDRATQRIGYKFESEEEWRTEEISFVREGDSWRRVVDVGVAQRVAAIIGIQKR